MSNWVSIIESHRAEYNLGTWGVIPTSHYDLIARECGPAELEEIGERLHSLDRELAEIPDWDGDAQDEIWRARQLFQAVLDFHAQSES